MSEVYEKLMKCYKSVREKTDFVPEAALILGSGLGDYADDLKIEASVNWKSPHSVHPAYPHKKTGKSL